MRRRNAAKDRFESDVISDGTQTTLLNVPEAQAFESDVISDGTQTGKERQLWLCGFESDVISDGTQTVKFFPLSPVLV